MRRAAALLLLASPLPVSACTPATSAQTPNEPPPAPTVPPTVELSPPPPAPAVPTPDAGPAPESATPVGGTVERGEEPSARSCRCDVLDFESDGPPKGQCAWLRAPDGTITLTGETSSPKFSAKLTPIVREPGRKRAAVDYVFEGDFQFACKKPWCGRTTLSVLEIGELDYRVTVARSADGPPSHVLWLTCTSP